MDLSKWQERTELLMGEKHKLLRQSSVLVVGLGGVGGIATEMLCRAGVGSLTIVDSDTVDVTNLNRQVYTNVENIGKLKAFELEKLLKIINPDVNVKAIAEYVKDESIVELLKSQKFDYVIDAIDTIAPKVYLIYNSLKLGYKIVSSMGAGGKLDPTQVKVDDISKSYNCQLARAVRKSLHKLGIHNGFKVVYSSEKADKSSLKYVDQDNKKTTLGTISYMPSIFGIYVSWVVINDLIKAD